MIDNKPHFNCQKLWKMLSKKSFEWSKMTTIYFLLISSGSTHFENEQSGWKDLPIFWLHFIVNQKAPIGLYCVLLFFFATCIWINCFLKYYSGWNDVLMLWLHFEREGKVNCPENCPTLTSFSDDEPLVNFWPGWDFLCIQVNVRHLKYCKILVLNIKLI